MENCPLGRYCPEPNLKLVCPEGKYCPYKSAEPWLDCPTCDEGATDLGRDFTGLIIMALLIPIIVLVLIASYLREKYKDAIAKNFKFLSTRRRHLNPQKIDKKKRQDQLSRLKPKLAVIAKRLNNVMAQNNASEATSESVTTASDSRKLVQLSSNDQSEEIDFDVRAVFDALDENGDGVLQYSELNVVLGFEKKELELFVASMSKLSSAANDTIPSRNKPNEVVTASVSRPVFVNYFLKALEGVANLQVSADEAAMTYDSILLDNGSPVLHSNDLYASSISNFLSDFEIMQLIKVRRNQ